MTRAIVGNLGGTVSKLNTAFVDISTVAAPYTTVVNRAQVTNFAADGLPKFGVNRVCIQQITEVQDERGPNGERVWKPINDFDDAVRFYGPWSNPIDANGQRPQGSSGAVCEITFYGTGLNLLRYNDSSNRTFSYKVNGGSATNVTGAWADIILNRNYNPNIIFPLVEGLPLGLHTVQLTSSSNALGVFGFEVINTSASIFLPVTQTYYGSRAPSIASTGSTAYNSGFESGTLGTRGGHVLVYQKADGTIGKAVTPTSGSAAYLSSTDHTNEEISRSYNWREFGAGRTDDFSRVGITPQSASFTLDDGSTILASPSVSVDTDSDAAFINNNTTGFLAITFVGTGLDVLWTAAAAGTNSNANAFEVFVDDVSVGNWDTLSPGDGVFVTKKVCSGLPYGTHTVRFQRNTPNIWTLGIRNFQVYTPRTPTLPTGAVALADYFVVANFAANTTAGIHRVATGVVRKNSIRELVYVNGTGGTTDWSIDSTVGLSPGASQLRTNRTNGYAEAVFFGTGFELRFETQSTYSNNILASLQSLSTGGSLQTLNTTNFPTISTSQYGAGASINSSTGVIVQGSGPGEVGAGVRVSGLPLGLYKLRLNNTTTSIFNVESLDVITPIHAPKDNGPFIAQNVLTIGSCAVRDLRKFSEQQVTPHKKVAQAIGITSGINNGSSTTFVPMQDMSATIKVSKPGFYSLSYHYTATPTGVGSSQTSKLFLNGAEVGVEKRADAGTATSPQISTSDEFVVFLNVGSHKVDVYWRTNGTGNATSNGLTRNLIVREL